MKTTCHLAILIVLVATPAFCQMAPPPARTLGLAGPRFGVTSLSPGIQEKLQQRMEARAPGETVAVRPLITQFGWQAEKQFYVRDSGVTALNEWVVLLGGLEQGIAIPSASWLVGLRTRDGAEFGVGPNLTPAGVALAVAAGMTFRAGAINVPMNVAVVPSQAGTRVSLLTGFTLRR
jgi:hypothetical protein